MSFEHETGQIGYYNHTVVAYSIVSLYGRADCPDDAEYCQPHVGNRCPPTDHLCTSYFTGGIILYRNRQDAEAIAQTLTHPRHDSHAIVCKQAIAGFDRNHNAVWFTERGIVR